MSDQPYEPTPPAAPAPGWYADPADPALQRYWDGAAWTAHTAPRVQQTAWPAAPGTPAAPMYGAPAYGGPAYAAAGWGVQPRSVGFGDAIKRAFRGWSDYSGRATVAEYWWFYLFSVLVTLVPYVLLLVATFALLPSAASSSSGSAASDPLAPRAEPATGAVALFVVLAVLFVVLAILLFVVQLALTVRRLHDTDREGWWYLISFVPFGGIVLLYFLVLPGTPGPNRYGPVPT